MPKQPLIDTVEDQRLVALQESELRAHALFTQTHDAVFLTSLDRVFLDVNPQAAALLGYSQQELIGMDSRLIIMPDEQEASTNLVNNLLSGANVPLYERRLRHRDGYEIPAEVNITLIHDHNDQPLYIQAIVRDITQRKQAEAALREREQRYSALFTQTHDAVLLVDVDGRCLDANPQATTLLGYSHDEFIGMETSRLIASHERDQSSAVFQALLRGEPQPLYERTYRHRDGHDIPVEINIALVRSAEGEPHYIQAIVRDITRRKNAQKRFAELLEQQSAQNALLDSILQSMADGVIVSDSDGRITLYNQAAQEMIGLEGEVGTDWTTQYPAFFPDQTTPVTQDDFPLRKAIKGESADEVEIVVQHPDYPDGLHTSRSARPIRDAEGNITGGVVVIHNITHRKQAEATALRLNEELATANADLEAYGHTIAHDLKTPLHIMGGYVDLLMDYQQHLPHEAQWMLKLVHRNVERMTGMINSMLLFARLRSVEETLHTVEMRPVIEAAAERLAQPLQDRGVTVTIEGDLPAVIGYAPWLEEVFANLISNAVKYMGHKTGEPTITIRARCEDGLVRCEVQDNGMGISEKNQAKLFQMFERFHKGHAEGTGLGLSIVARIIAKLGGQIGVISTPNAGSTFWFTLPATNAIHS